MTPYEMMLSESQERMLMVLKPGREAEAEAIFRKWELDFAVIGEVTDTGRMVLEWNGETVADIPLGPLADEAPLLRPAATRVAEGAGEPLADVPESTDIAADLLKLMASPDLASRRWIWEQYDQQVGADTVQRPGGDAAVVRVHGTEEGAGDHHRLHAALLLCRPVSRAASRRSPKPIATSARSAPGRWRSPTASTSATRSGPRSWASSSAASKAWPRPAARSTSRS